MTPKCVERSDHNNWCKAIRQAIADERAKVIEECAKALDTMREACGGTPYNCATCAAFIEGAAAIRARGKE
jgi:hypothetical protein